MRNKENIFRDLTQGVSIKYLPTIISDNNGIYRYRSFKFDVHLPKIFLVFEFQDIYQLAISQNSNERQRLARKIREYVIE